MTDAFILGAGFSKAIADTMPLTQELGLQSIKQLKDGHASRVLPGNHSVGCDGLSCDGFTPLPTFTSGALNFEEWLSTLAEPQPFHLAPENARRQALVSEFTGSVSTMIDVAESKTVYLRSCPDWLARLVENWHAHQTHVVTFNYDTLIEATVDSLSLFDSENKRVLHENIGPAVIPRWQMTTYAGLRPPARQSFQYLKLHGSNHWYWDDVTKAADSIVQIGLRHMWEEREPRFTDEERRNYRAPGKVPMIVPPVTVKSTYFGNPMIRYLWHTAFFGLGMAQRVFVFGYSLPPGDLLVRSMLAEVLANKEVWVIDTDPKVAERFAKLMPATVRDFGEGTVIPADFVSAYVAS